MPSAQSGYMGLKDNVFRSVATQEEAHGFMAIGRCLPHPRLPDWNGVFPLFHFQEGVSEFISRHLGGLFSSYACAGPVNHCSIVAMGEG